MEAAPFIKSGHSGVPVVKMAGDGRKFELAANPPPLQGCTHLEDKRDGSKTDFQGLHGFLHYALFERATGVRMVNVCCQAEDGKGAADGLSRVVSQGCRVLVLQGKNPGADSRGLLQLIAANRQRPKQPRNQKRGLTAVTNFVYCYAGDADRSAFAGFEAAAGYKGSNRDHFYAMDPKTRGGAGEPDAGSLFHMNRPCGCTMCLQGRHSSCQVKRLFPNESGTSWIQRKAGAAARVQRSARVTAAFANAVVDQSVLVARVDRGEPNIDDEPYFLAVAVKDDGDPELPVVWRQQKSGYEGPNYVTKGTWLVRLRWLHYHPLETHTAFPGGRAYKFQSAEPVATFPCKGLVATKVAATAMAKVKELGGYYWVPEASHRKVIGGWMDLIADSTD